MKFFLREIDAFESNQIKNQSLALAYDNLAKVYIRQTEFAEAIKAHEKSISIVQNLIEKANDDDQLQSLEKDLCFYYNNTGNTYKRLSDDKYTEEERKEELKDEDIQALANFRKHLIVAQTFPDPTEYIKGCVNTASVFREIGYLDTALAYILRGEEKFFAMEDSIQAISRQVLASIFTQKGRIMEEYCNLSEATSLHHSARKIYSELKDYSLLVLPLLNLGNTYESFGYLDSALYYYQSALKIEQDSLTIIEPGRKEKILRSLSSVYAKQHEYQKAYENFKLFSDSKINSLSQQRDTSIKNVKENAKLWRENEKRKEEFEYEKQKNKVIIGGMFLIALAAGFFLYLNDRNQKLAFAKIKSDKAAEREKFENEISNITLEAEEKLLQTRNEVQENAMRQAGKDLHDEVGNTLISLKRTLDLTPLIVDVSQEKIKDHVSLIQELVQISINNTRLVTHNLNTLSLQGGLISALEELIGRSKKISEETRIEFKAFNLKEETLKTRAEVYLFRIIQESLSNIMKYAQAKNVFIQLIADNNNLKLDIEDDGIGFNYDPGSTKAGLGLLSMESRAKELGGTFQLVSKENEGVKINISIPLKKITHQNK
ncbi:MAG: sensor histidine kinase [Bacteroidia bacterium]